MELSALGPKALSFTSQTSSQQSAEERGLHCPPTPAACPAPFRRSQLAERLVVPHLSLLSLQDPRIIFIAGVVEAEVFENERFLPFRGWGHEWPGHLLPTDRVGHWSLRGDRPSGAESMDFHRVAPALPQVCAAAQSMLSPT